MRLIDEWFARTVVLEFCEILNGNVVTSGFRLFGSRKDFVLPSAKRPRFFFGKEFYEKEMADLPILGVWLSIPRSRPVPHGHFAVHSSTCVKRNSGPIEYSQLMNSRVVRSSAEIRLHWVIFPIPIGPVGGLNRPIDQSNGGSACSWPIGFAPL